VTSRREFFTSAIGILGGIIGSVPWLGEKLKGGRWDITVKRDLVLGGAKHPNPFYDTALGESHVPDPSVLPLFVQTYWFSMMDESSRPFLIRFGLDRLPATGSPSYKHSGEITGYIDLHTGKPFASDRLRECHQFHLSRYPEQAIAMRERLMELYYRVHAENFKVVNGTFVVSAVSLSLQVMITQLQTEFIVPLDHHTGMQP